MQKCYFIVFCLFLILVSCDFGDGSVLDSVKKDILEQNGRPNFPLNFQVSEKTYNSVTLSWQDNSKIEDGYLVEVSTDGSNFTEVVKLDEDVEQYTYSNLTEITKYYYRVCAYNENGVTPTNSLEKNSGIGNKLIAHYKFEENCSNESGGNSAYTASNMVNGPKPGYTDGPAGFGKAINFAKSSQQYMTILTSSEFDVDQTISFWFNARSLDNSDRILLRGGQGIGGYRIEFWANKLIVQTFDDAGHNDYFALDDELATDTWYHIVVSINSTDKKVQIYKNNVLVDDGNAGYATVWPSGYDMKFSYDEYAVTNYFDGALDDLRFYEGSLSAQAISCIYNGDL